MPRKDPRAKGFGPISEEHCKEIIERAPDAILFLDTSGKIVYCNAATARMTGFKKTELIGAHYNRLGALKLLDIPKYMLMFNDLLGGRDIKPFETTWRNKRGEIVYTEAHVGTIKEKGKIKWVQAIVRDLTERRCQGESMEESEERYKTMIEESAYAMMLIDAYGNLIFSNKATDAITGRQYIDDTGRNILKLGIIARDDIPKVKKAVEEILSGKKIVPFEIRMTRGDNVELIVEAHGVMIDYMGEPAVLATLRDITERKKIEEALRESEEKYRSVVENATDQIFMLDNKGRFLSVNNTAANLIRKPAKELIGKPISQFFPEETASRFAKNFEEVFRTGKSKSLEEKMNVGGREFYNGTSLNPVKDDKGKVVAVTGIVRDITVAKMNEIALKESEERLKIVLDSMPDTIVMLDSKGMVRYANRALGTTFGIKEEEVENKSAMDLVRKFVPLSDAPRVIKSTLEAIRGEGKPMVVSINTARRGPVMIETVLFYIELRGERHTVVVMKDVTERVKVEEALKESEERFRAIFESSNDGILIANTESKKFEFGNKAIEKMLGYSQKELREKSVMDIHPKKDLPYVLSQFRKQAKKEITLAENLPVLRKDGSVFHADVNSFPINLAGKLYLAGVFRDVTERKRVEEALKGSEERFKLLFEYAPDAYYINDMIGTFIDGNIAAEKLTGYSRKELIGKSFLKLKLLSASYVLKAAGLLRKNLMGQPTGPDEFMINRKDGSKVTAEISTYPIKIGGKMVALGIARDITERKKVEELIKNYSSNLEVEVRERTHELVSEKEKVEALSSMKDEFIKNVSHELRTPLSVVIGNLKLLRDIAPTGGEKDWAKSLDMLDRNTGRMTNSINKIIELNELSVMTPRRERIYLNDIAEEAYKEQLQFADKKGLKMELDAEPVAIIGDRMLMKMAFMNLISNAVKFTPKGKVSIALRALDGTVSMKVTDTGIGMSPETQKRLFEKFFKADPSAPGTGIGLNIAKQIVEKHGGSINVKSKLGKGSTFEIVLLRGTEAKVKGEVKDGIKKKKGKHKKAAEETRLLLAGIAPKEWAR